MKDGIKGPKVTFDKNSSRKLCLTSTTLTPTISDSQPPPRLYGLSF
jgi:hypothetical protein